MLHRIVLCREIILLQTIALHCSCVLFHKLTLRYSLASALLIRYWETFLRQFAVGNKQCGECKSHRIFTHFPPFFLPPSPYLHVSLILIIQALTRLSSALSSKPNPPCSEYTGQAVQYTPRPKGCKPGRSEWMRAESTWGNLWTGWPGLTGLPGLPGLPGNENT